MGNRKWQMGNGRSATRGSTVSLVPFHFPFPIADFVSQPGR
jgi:hypothetical protein